MTRKSGNSFGNFSQSTAFDPRPVKPITTEFSKGSVQGSLYAINRESAWTRWRRGYELATSSSYINNYSYRFQYSVPFAEGILPPGTEYPPIKGFLQGFPTASREFHVHWSGKKTAGSVRFDQLKAYVILSSSNWNDLSFTDYINVGQWFDEDSTVEEIDASIESVTEDADYWYVKLKGRWSETNKLPPPLYIDLGGSIGGLKALNGEVLEDRVISQDADFITRDSIDPNTQKRYGYVQAVLVDVNEVTGVLTLKKDGSVEATPDRTLVTPATRPPSVGRYFITGPRYACTCQDYTRREYSYMRDLGAGNKKAFPRTNVSNVKPGRYEILRSLGIVDNAAMTDADVERILEIIVPSQDFTLPGTVTSENIIDLKAARDNPGVYREFGALYLRTTQNPGLSGSSPEGMPSYNDYSAFQNEVTSLTDIWSPVLDEIRYCKHIYAMRFQDDVFPPEPSDFPVGIGSMVAWEQELVDATEKEQDKTAKQLGEKALMYMDVPPYNCQSQSMQPMLQRLFNVPLSYIKIDGFTMYDKNGIEYVPAAGGRPSV